MEALTNCWQDGIEFQGEALSVFSIARLFIPFAPQLKKHIM